MAFHRNNNGPNNRYNNNRPNNFRPRHNNQYGQQSGAQQGRRHVNRVNHVFESTGPDGRVRGTAQQLVEKYVGMARDAQAGGDPVLMLNYYQHAEHYQRLYTEIMEENGAFDREREAQRSQYNQQPQIDGETGFASDGARSDAGQNPGSTAQGQQQDYNARDERQAEPQGAPRQGESRQSDYRPQRDTRPNASQQSGLQQAEPRLNAASFDGQQAAAPQNHQRKPDMADQPTPVRPNMVQPNAAQPDTARPDAARPDSGAMSTGGRVLGRRPAPARSAQNGDPEAASNRTPRPAPNGRNATPNQFESDDLPSFLKQDIPIKPGRPSETPAPRAPRAAPKPAAPAADEPAGVTAAFGKRKAPVTRRSTAEKAADAATDNAGDAD